LIFSNKNSRACNIFSSIFSLFSQLNNFAYSEPCDLDGFTTKSQLDAGLNFDEFYASFLYPSVASGTKVTCTARCTTTGTANIRAAVGSFSGALNAQSASNDAGCPVTVEMTASSEGAVYVLASGAIAGTNGLSKGSMYCITSAGGEGLQTVWGRVQSAAVSLFDNGARRLRGFRGRESE